jgi:hypothetical protein
VRRLPRTTLLALSAAAAAAACGGAVGSGGSVQHSGGRSPAATSAPLADWQKLGATLLPPASLQQASLGSIALDNQARPAVSDAQAHAWAEAYLRTLGYLTWAVDQGQDTFLLRSGIASAPAVVQPNVADVIQARQAGRRVVYRNPTIRRMVIRPVPQGLQAALQGQEFTWKPYAIFLDQVGPAAKTWVDPQGHESAKAEVPAGAASYELVGGEVSHVPPMGDVWAMASDASCTSADARQALAPLCNP